MIYLFDVDKGGSIERFATEDPVQSLDKIVKSEGAKLYPDFIVRIERMDVESYPIVRSGDQQETKEDSPKNTEKA